MNYSILIVDDRPADLVTALESEGCEVRTATPGMAITMLGCHHYDVAVINQLPLGMRTLFGRPSESIIDFCRKINVEYVVISNRPGKPNGTPVLPRHDTDGVLAHIFDAGASSLSPKLASA